MKIKYLLVLSFILLSSCNQQPTHTHSFGKDYKNDENFHWHECSCGEKDEMLPHHFDKGTVIKDKTCTKDGDKLYVCEDCGYEHHEVIPKGHTFSTTYSYDESYHWYAATCEHTDEKKDYGLHNFVIDKDDPFYKTCSSCGYRISSQNKLKTPTNLDFLDNILTFDAVEFAKEYQINLYKNGTLVDTNVTSKNSYEITYEPGLYTVGVIAKHDLVVSEEATLNIKVLYKDAKQLFEAENCLLSLKHYSIDEHAHGGAYALDFNDCGQGIAITYFAFEAGQREMELCYSTATPNSKMMITLEGVKQTDVIFPENTGWFGDTRITALTTTNIYLNKGWNHISLLKDGTDADIPQYGGNVQLDYITISGTDKYFDIDSFVEYKNINYRFEAESANWHYANDTQRPINWSQEGFSSNYGLGEINANGDGVKFEFKVAISGTYFVQLVYGRGNGIHFTYRLNEGASTDITLNNNSSGWNDPLPDQGFEISLEKGIDNTLDFIRPEGDCWITIDCLLLSLR